MPQMSEPTPLGRLLKARRKKNRVSWKRLEHAVGLEDQTMMRWERGVTRDPPIGKVLLYAREVGISLAELEAVLLPTNGRSTDKSVNARAEDALAEVEAIGAQVQARRVRRASPRAKRPPAG